MSHLMDDASTHSGSLHSFAVEALKASRSRGRAQKGAPYAGLLLDRLVEDFRTGRSTYDLARRGVRASLSERRQSPLLRTLHAMALHRLDAMRENSLDVAGSAGEGDAGDEVSDKVS
jgi:hypothetical protein